MKLTTQQLRQVIREELRKTRLNEGISKGDLVFFRQYENERGMTVSKGVTVGRVSNVIGSKNIEVTALSPSNIKGDVVKVKTDYAKPFPKNGQKVRLKAEFNSGSGSGSQSFHDIEGSVISADPVKAEIVVKTKDGNVKLHLSQILKMNEGYNSLNEAAGKIKLPTHFFIGNYGKGNKYAICYGVSGTTRMKTKEIVMRGKQVEALADKYVKEFQVHSTSDDSYVTQYKGLVLVAYDIFCEIDPHEMSDLVGGMMIQMF